MACSSSFRGVLTLCNTVRCQRTSLVGVVFAGIIHLLLCPRYNPAIKFEDVRVSTLYHIYLYIYMICAHIFLLSPAAKGFLFLNLSGMGEFQPAVHFPHLRVGTNRTKVKGEGPGNERTPR